MSDLIIKHTKIYYFYFFCMIFISISSAQSGSFYEPDNPKQDGGGSGGDPIAKINLTIFTETDSGFRDGDIYLCIFIKNNEPKKIKISYINLELGIFYNTSTREKEIRIPKFELKENDSRIYRYRIHIPKNADLGQIKLIPQAQFNDLDNIIHIRNRNIDRKMISLSDNFCIKNNAPIIDSGTAIINSENSILLDDNNRLYLLSNNPIEAQIKIIAHDVEDEEELQYSSYLLTNNSKFTKY